MENKSADSPSTSSASRFEWLDGVRGMAIIWITFFHCFLAYGVDYPWPVKIGSFSSLLLECSPQSFLENIACGFGAILAGLIQRGAQGVGVFILFSGFGLTYSLVKRGGKPAWGRWYKRRFIRLFPIYWFAHLLFLVSPFQYQRGPIDYRFLLSLLGDRVYPVDKIFYYLVPAWWFLGLLIELYIVFPFLYRLMQRLGPVKYLTLCIVLTSACRYLLFGVLEVNGNYVQGAFFVCRLWEFAAGMVFGKLMAEKPGKTLERLFSWKGFIFGVAVYSLGLLTYQPNFLYSFSDGLTAMGLSIIMIHIVSRTGMVPGLGRAFAAAGIYSYGIYLFHQPYVMFVGEKLRPYPIGIFFVVSTAAIVLISLAAMRVESLVDRLAARYLRA